MALRRCSTAALRRRCFSSSSSSPSPKPRSSRAAALRERLQAERASLSQFAPAETSGSNVGDGQFGDYWGDQESVRQLAARERSYFIETFGCQMNASDR